MVSAALLVACADSKPAEPGMAAGALPDSAAGQQTAPAAADSTLPISTRTVIYIEASEAELDAWQAKLTEEELNIAGDDFMWYRSQAFDHIEQQGWPLRTLVGKRPLTFMVDGEARRYDLADAATLDVIILYDANQEPRIIAPIDIEQADAYFR